MPALLIRMSMPPKAFAAFDGVCTDL
jgi:hypothetical protein